MGKIHIERIDVATPFIARHASGSTHDQTDDLFGVYSIFHSDIDTLLVVTLFGDCTDRACPIYRRFFR